MVRHFGRTFTVYTLTGPIAWNFEVYTLVTYVDWLKCTYWQDLVVWIFGVYTLVKLMCISCKVDCVYTGVQVSWANEGVA